MSTIDHNIAFKASQGQVSVKEAEGIVECFVAGIGNKDSVNDIVLPGAFNKSLMRRKPRVVWGHNWNDPIGKVLEIYEVPATDPRLPMKMKAAGIGGLYARVQFNLNSEKGREAFANVAFFGLDQEWSIGYKTIEATYDPSRQANLLREVELYELSPVLHGANQLTGTISIKSDEEKMHMARPDRAGMPIVIARPIPVSLPADNNIFASGTSQPIGNDQSSNLMQELASRAGGPVVIREASENIVVFAKPNGATFRVAYYRDPMTGQFMFGKPERVIARMTYIPLTPGTPSGPSPMAGVVGKPREVSPIQQAYSADNDSPAMPSVSFGVVMPKEEEKSAEGGFDNEVWEDTSIPELLIKCPIELAFETKSMLDPVLDYHRLESEVTEDGIIVTSPVAEEAFDAIQTAVKGIGRAIGRAITPGGGPKKVRRAARALARITGELDPRKRRDMDRDGKIFDDTPWERPDPTLEVPPAQTAFRSRSRIDPFNLEKNTVRGLRGGLEDDSSKGKYAHILTRQQVPLLVDYLDEFLKSFRHLDSSDGGGALGPADNKTKYDMSSIKTLRDALQNSKRSGSGKKPDIAIEDIKKAMELHDSVMSTHGGSWKWSKRDELAAKEYFVDPTQILGNMAKGEEPPRRRKSQVGRARKKPRIDMVRPRAVPKQGESSIDQPSAASAKVTIAERPSEVWPDNYKNMTTEEKLEWMLANGTKPVEKNGKKIQLSEEDREKIIYNLSAQLAEEEEAMERRAERARRMSREITEEEKAEMEEARKQSQKRRRSTEGTERQTPSGQSVPSEQEDSNRSSTIIKQIDKQLESFSKLADKLHKENNNSLADLIDGLERDVSASLLDDDPDETSIDDAITRAYEFIDELQSARAEGNERQTKKIDGVISEAKKLIDRLEKASKKKGGGSDEDDELSIESILAGSTRGASLSDMGDDIDSSFNSPTLRSASRSASSYLSRNSRKNQAIAGFRSSSRRPSNLVSREDKIDISGDESMFKQIADVLPREIRSAEKNSKTDVARGLRTLQSRLQTRGKRDSLKLNKKDTDAILEALLAVIDRQMERGHEERAIAVATFMEMLAQQAVSTFLMKG